MDALSHTSPSALAVLRGRGLRERKKRHTRPAISPTSIRRGETGGLIARIASENVHVPEAARAQLAGEMRLLRTIDKIIVAEMVARLR